MKIKKLKRSISVLMAAAIVLTSISFNSVVTKAARIDVSSGMTAIKGSKWEEPDNPANPTNNHIHSSFDTEKSRAFEVDGKFASKLQTTGDTDFKIESGNGGEFPKELSDAGLGSSLYNDNTNWKWFNVNTNSSGSIQVKWTNLRIRQKNDKTGAYENVYVDVVRTLDYTLYGDRKTVEVPQEGKDPVTVNAYVGMGPGLSATAFIGVAEVRVKNDFYEAGTNTKKTLDTNITLTDIDDGQYIAVKAEKVEGEFTDGDTKLSWKNDSNGRTIYYYPKMTNESGGADCAAGFTFGGNGFEYTFGRVVKNGEDKEIPPTGSVQYIGTGQNMMRFKLPEPAKTVTDKSPYYASKEEVITEKDVVGNNIKDVTEHWTYEIEQEIPQNIAEKHRYDTFSLHDELDKCLKVDSVKVYYGTTNAAGKDVTDWFTIDKTNNKVSATLKKSNNNDDFYSHNLYRMVIEVHLDGAENWKNLTQTQKETLEKKWNDDGHPLEAHAHYFTINNQAESRVDGEIVLSNSTSTRVLENPEPTKSVTDIDEVRVVNNHCRNVMEEWEYRVSQVVPYSAGKFGGYDDFQIIDEIEECMEIKSVKVEQMFRPWADAKPGEGKDVSNWFNITTVGNTVTASLIGKGFLGNPEFYAIDRFDAELSYELVIKVGLKGVDNWESMTDAEKTALENVWKSHGHYNTTETTITEYNTAQRIIDGDVRTTNRTTTVIDLSTDSNGTPGLAITKDVNRYEHQVGDTVSYTVTVWNTNPKADTAGFKVWDTTLPDSMELDFDSVKVAGISSDNYTLTKQGNGWVLKSKGTYALPYGTKIVITYDAKALIPSNGTLVDNTAKTTAIGIPEKSDSEQVYINSPKNIVVKTAPHTKYKVGDTVGYDVTITNFNPGTFMRNVVLTDVVDTPGLSIKEGSVAVLVGGRDVTSQVDVVFDDDGKGFTIKTPFNLYNGDLPVLTDACTNPNPYTSITNWTDKIKVTYDATITDEAALEENLKNTFTAPATPNTNGDLIRDDETVPSGGGSDDEEIPMKKPMLDIVKSSNKQTYKVGETGKYTLKVTQTKDDLTAKNVVVKDTFINQDGMEIDAASIKVLFNKNDITKQCTITAGKTDFVIQTGKDLTDEDLITVTYDVLFTQEGTYDNTAVASSDNTDEAEDDNEVVVEEKTPGLRITKESDKKEYNVGETGLYTLNVTERVEGAVAKNLVIEDAFTQKDGLATDTNSIKVLFNGTDITADCEITANSTDFNIKTHKDLTDEDLITVTYNVLFTQEGTYDNTAVASSDNTNEAEDDNEVIVKALTPALSIKKNSNKKSYGVGDTGKYTLLVNQTVQDAIAENVVIEDAFVQQSGLMVRGKSIKIYLNGKDITKQCGIESDKRDFKIDTGCNMTVDDVIKVTYDVLFTQEGTYDNTAVASSDNADNATDENTVNVADPEPEKPTPKPQNPISQLITAPQTGGTVLPIHCFVAIVILVALVGLGFYYFGKKKKKNENEEK